MKRYHFKYLFNLTLQDFLVSSTPKQLEKFKKQWPNFDMNLKYGATYAKLEVDITILIDFMIENKIGYFNIDDQKQNVK